MPGTSGTRRRLVLLLALTLGLVSADSAALGASGPAVMDAMHIGHSAFGLVASAHTAAGAIATVPFGVLVDRVRRTRLLAWAAAAWTLTSLATAGAWSFPTLLTGRVLLGVLTAVAGPAVASLLGDMFSVADRTRVYGNVLAGELLGTGAGFVISGELAAVSWRLALGVLALPAAVLTVLLWRAPEPERGGAPDHHGGQEESSDQSSDDSSDQSSDQSSGASSDASSGERAEPESLLRVVVYVLRIKTNLILIVASACGYFFMAGIHTFAVTFARAQYGVGQSVSTALVMLLGAGALGGVLTGGRIADRLRARGVVAARPIVAAAGVLAATVLFAPALIVTMLPVAIPLLIAAAWSLGVLNPPTDAARLDILPPRLWGRGEAVRTVARASAEAIAPLLFGYLSDTIAGGGQAGMRAAFLISLGPLLLAGGLALVAVRTYPRDAARAQSLARGPGSGPRGERSPSTPPPHRPNDRGRSDTGSEPRHQGLR